MSDPQPSPAGDFEEAIRQMHDAMPAHGCSGRCLEATRSSHRAAVAAAYRRGQEHRQAAIRAYEEELEIPHDPEDCCDGAVQEVFKGIAILPLAEWKP